MTALVSTGFEKALRISKAFAWVIRFFFAGSLLLIAAGLWCWGAAEVRGHLHRVVLLSLIGLAWLFVSSRLFPWLGISISDDVIERRNLAALLPSCGAIVAVALIFAGGSLGEGPSYWNNLFSAMVGTIGFFVLWMMLELTGDLSMSIAEERDLATGVRLCGFMLAVGLLLGRAVAGDWHSESATVHDFLRDGWPAAGLGFLASIIERLARPSRERPSRPWRLYGLLPALAYSTIAIVWLSHLGRWEGMPA